MILYTTKLIIEQKIVKIRYNFAIYTNLYLISPTTKKIKDDDKTNISE